MRDIVKLRHAVPAPLPEDDMINKRHIEQLGALVVRHFRAMAAAWDPAIQEAGHLQQKLRQEVDTCSRHA